MAISERVVLFHDDPPQGPGASELLDEGLGLAPGVVVFPEPGERLRLDRQDRTELLVRRFAPALCLGFPARSRVIIKGTRFSAPQGVLCMRRDGSPRAVRPEEGRRVTHRSAPAIQELLASSPDAAKVQAFLASGKRFPIVEGSSVTFIWHGQADGVTLRHWIYGLESDSALVRVTGTDLFYLTLEIPHGSRVEYKYELHRGGGSQWIEDPFNPNRARDPFGANSVLQGEGYAIPTWTNKDPLAREGTIETFGFNSHALGGRRTGHIYLPARFRKTRLYPLLVVHDGSDYLKYTGMKTVLDNLIHSLEIPDVIVAFTDSPDRAARVRERRAPRARSSPRSSSPTSLRASPSTTARRRAASWARASALSRRSPPRTATPASGGASSCSRGHSRSPTSASETAAARSSTAWSSASNQYREEPIAVSERVFVSCGVYESLIYENRSMVPLLDDTGMQVRFVEARDGHNWENWRDRLREGLSWVFPGPLMFVYE